ncbi:MAG: 3-oxoacyl-ACP reductase FabG [Verrucomicrobia bacterium]|nr:3-oxoacyl-ACP reductase FabG [Verrucomicrobiota bacterium]
MSPFDLSGKIALVTGASRGIGAGIAQALSAHGAHVLVNYFDDPAGVNRGEAETVVQSCRSAELCAGDVSKTADVSAMFAHIQEKHGGLDVLIANAGILRDRTLAKMTDEEFESVIDVNLGGVFRCFRAATTGVREHGRIVALSSVAGQMGFFGQANYAPSKGGVISLVKVAARELARRKITVNAIAPGFITTAMTATMPPEVIAKTAAQVPLGAWGEIADIVHATLFLCSPGARYITGHVLNVNGGFYMGS